jgi:hypothetical protein
MYQVAVFVEPTTERGRNLRSTPTEAKAAFQRIQRQVASRRRRFASEGEGALFAPGQMQESCFHVLAGAEPIDPEVDASAGKLPIAEFANFHIIGHAAAGPYPEVGENGMAEIGANNPERLGARPQAASVDFVLVTRFPIMDRRECYFIDLGDVPGHIGHHRFSAERVNPRMRASARFRTACPKLFTQRRVRLTEFEAGPRSRRVAAKLDCNLSQIHHPGMSLLELKQEVSRLNKRERQELQTYLIRLRHDTPEWKKATAKRIKAMQAGHRVTAEELEARIGRA